MPASARRWQRSLLSLLLFFLATALAEPLAHAGHFAPDLPLEAAYPGLAPGYLLGLAPPVLRRDGGGCATDYHSCLDINSSLCCPDDKYCMIDVTSLEPACCSIGSLCGSPCSASQYECNATTTLTVTASTATATASEKTSTTSKTSTSSSTHSVITTTSVYTACCARRCPVTSQFACASSLGGGCCSYGQTCGTSQCIWTVSSTTATDATPTLMAAETCGTSQVTCAPSLTAGCCSSGYQCTTKSGALSCALMTAVATEVVTTTGGSSDLSAGAKAGIAVGSIVGAAAIVGAATWVFLYQRKRRHSTTSGRSQGEMEPYQYTYGGEASGGPPGSLPGPPSGGVVAGAAVGGSGTSSRHPAGSSSVGVSINPQGPNDIVAPVEIDSTAVVRSESSAPQAGAAGAAAAAGAAGATMAGPTAAGQPGYTSPADEKSQMERLAYTATPPEMVQVRTVPPPNPGATVVRGHMELDGEELPPAPMYSEQLPAQHSSNSPDDSPVLPRDSPTEARRPN